jgi:hypothetical protein
MTVKQLIKKLQKYPEDLKVWVSDNGYCEGATPFKEFKVEQAYKVGLDGDEVDDEYTYIDDETEEEINKYMKEKNYQRFGNVLSKKILMIYGK